MKYISSLFAYIYLIIANFSLSLPILDVNEDREKRKIEEVEAPNENKQEVNKKPKVPITAPQINEENKQEISKKVLKQVHFYFSDSNMNDKYLRGKIKESSDEYIELSEITNFNRMKS